MREKKRNERYNVIKRSFPTFAFRSQWWAKLSTVVVVVVSIYPRTERLISASARFGQSSKLFSVVARRSGLDFQFALGLGSETERGNKHRRVVCSGFAVCRRFGNGWNIDRCICGCGHGKAARSVEGEEEKRSKRPTNSGSQPASTYLARTPRFPKSRHKANPTP